MISIDSGYLYLLQELDGSGTYAFLKFVKRRGPNYPANTNNYPGTTSSEVIRALIDQTKSLDNLIHNRRNKFVLRHLRDTLFELEIQAAEMDNRVLPEFDRDLIEHQPTCDKCTHIGCPGTCR